MSISGFTNKCSSFVMYHVNRTKKRSKCDPISLEIITLKYV